MRRQAEGSRPEGARPGEPSPGTAGRSFILTVNGGSSSLKFCFFHRSDPPARRALGRIERIGLAGTRLAATGVGGTIRDAGVEASDHRAAAGLLVEWVDHEVGCRCARRGRAPRRPRRRPIRRAATGHVDLLGELRRISPYDPEHLPGEVALSRRSAGHPALPQVACFDTAFHHDLPRVAQLLPFPRRFEAGGAPLWLSRAVVRLSDGGAPGSRGPRLRGARRAAHLGAGASLAAVHGLAVDTTMGFTPAAGLSWAPAPATSTPASSVPDDGGGLTAEAFHALGDPVLACWVSRRPAPISAICSPARRRRTAGEAVELFCYRVKSGIGALAAPLGGLETLAFAGGIGENAPRCGGDL